MGVFVMKHGEARFLSCMYVLSLALLAAFALHGLKETTMVSAAGDQRQLIILDAGHGGTDGGASGPDGTRECDLNLAIVKKLDAVFGLLGEETLLIRDSDTDLASIDAQSISQKKVSDIRARTEIVNSHPEALLLSIHQNTYSASQYHGAQVFYTRSGEEAKELAKALQQALKTHVDPENTRAPKGIYPDVYLMNHIKTPGLLVECGFLTNPQELQNLKDEGYQKRLAVTIAAAIGNHRSERASGV